MQLYSSGHTERNVRISSEKGDQSNFGHFEGIMRTVQVRPLFGLVSIRPATCKL